MKPINIISAYNSSQLKIDNKELIKGFNLSIHESKTLSKFIDLLKEQGVSSICFNGYYVSYSIKQISKEFDLLRFSDDLVINIELKSPLEPEIKLEKISRQMEQNYYYLKFLEKKVIIYTYVEDDGLYTFNCESSQVLKVDVSQLVEDIIGQDVNCELNPDNLFIPRNYLVSPFNNTERFLNREYFLTDHQFNIKKEILDNIERKLYQVYCIQANAGTGKTLLGYDLARHMLSCTQSPLIVHCGKLNGGHLELISSEWKIKSIRDIDKSFVDTWNNTNMDIIIVDESQRISLYQLELIIDKSFELKVPIVFMYDTNQYLKEGETRNIYDYINENKKNIPLLMRKLTNKIRTNKELTSFINNLVYFGSSRVDLNYKDISIEYFSELEDVIEYINYLYECEDWKAITFTTSMHNHETLDEIACVSETKAHHVIGQEFNKVVFVMDSNFKYKEDGRLVAKRTYYTAKGMLYQIVTRAVEELKIIVLDNPDLFYRLLEIKHNTFIHESE